MQRADIFAELSEIFLGLFGSDCPENVKPELPSDLHVHLVAVVRGQLIIRRAAQSEDRIAYAPATWKNPVNGHGVDV